MGGQSDFIVAFSYKSISKIRCEMQKGLKKQKIGAVSLKLFGFLWGRRKKKSSQY